MGVVVTAGGPVEAGLPEESKAADVLPAVAVVAGSVGLVVGAFRSGITTVVKMLVVVGTAGSEEVVGTALVGTVLASVAEEGGTAVLV